MHTFLPGRGGFLTAPGIDKNYPIKFLIFIQGGGEYTYSTFRKLAYGLAKTTLREMSVIN